MIHLITGGNNYDADQKIRELRRGYTGEVERYDGSDLTLETLASIMTGVTLFTTKRFVVVRDVSANKPVWDKLGEWCQVTNDDLTLLIVETHVDKRTKAYKSLMKYAQTFQTKSWTERDLGAAEAWTDRLAQQLGMTLKPALVADIVERSLSLDSSGKAYVIDQYVIAHALRSLSLLETITPESIDAVLPISSFANVFLLIELALERNHDKLVTLLAKLRHSEDAYKIFGLIASQWFQFVAVKHATKPPSEISRDLAVHPFVAQKLARYSSSVSSGDAKRLTRLIADLDARMKSSAVDPWTLVDRFLLALATR